MNRLFIAVNRLCSLAEQSPPEEGWGLKRHGLILVLSVTVAAYAAVALGQDCTWDVLNYHFYSGFAFLAKPLNYDFAPAQVQSFFNPLMHVLSYLLLAHLPSIAVSLLLGAIQGLNFYLVFQISQVLFRNWPDPFRFLLCFCNAAAGCYSSVFILELGGTFGDSLSSLLILSGLLLIFRYLLALVDAMPAPDALLGIAGAILGAAFGLKLTVAIYIAAIAVSLYAVLLLWNRRIRPLFIFFGFLGLGFVAVYGIWGYSLYREYQNPVFPYMNSIFHSPYYDPINLTDARFFSRTWQQRHFYPFFFARKNSLVSEMPFRDIRLAFCYIAIVVQAAVGLACLLSCLTKLGKKFTDRLRSPSMLMLTLFFAVSYLLWQNQFSVYRYLIVLELLAPTYLALVLASFIKKRFWVLAFSLLLNVTICAVMIPANFGRQKFDDEFLKAEIPTIEDLDKSVVLMSGGEGTSFIIPYFPAETRFVRISSNFHHPGQNARLDEKIRRILAQYDAKHTYVYIAESQDKEEMRKELNFYGVKFADQSCRAVLRQAGDGGYICGTAAERLRSPGIPGQQSSLEPVFKEIPAVRLQVSPDVVVDKEIVHLHLLGLNLKAIDVLYTINGERQLPQKKLFLDKHQLASLTINSTARRGLYRFIGIRSSAAHESDQWVKVDARLLIR